MNKKVIILIIALIIVAVTGISIYTLSKDDDNTTTANQQSDNTSVENNESDLEAGNVLIVYFSQTGNTETVANIIHDNVGGDIVKLETTEAYPSDYDELVDYAHQEQQEDARPELSTVIENIEQYDTIFLGYPNWWGDMPMAIYTFLDTYDLSGKTIAPFITHGGSGLSGTPENIQEEELNATVTEGLAIDGDEASDSSEDVVEWLNSLGF
ncbi:flavodoxin [Thomasclavelia spiroformis]|uniref:flavodoxin n=1 Tax=Thomasclavelia spiroformis TaxID=29348 RepID=UPI00241E9760|nr:flavodoxin [Thomasclavelia spiroformis]MBS6685815.1 NAD(P)H-dependent oxidoreductase [Thomasclavelia spiroformis]